MNTVFNYGHWDLWQLYQKVTFDGANRIIRVNPGVTELDIKSDIYSDWKEWVRASSDNAVWLPAIRTIGGDPTVEGQFAGDIYFLINGWKLYIDLTKVKVTGVLFSDDYETAYFSYDDVIQYPVQVSSIVSGSAQLVNSASITQANNEILNKVLEVWQLMGLDLSNPKTITDSSITVNGITLTIGQPDKDTTTVTRS
jgi:hypothetical protein